MMRSSRRAQSTTDYVILVAFLVIGAILAITFFGNDLKALFFGSSSGMRKGDRASGSHDGGAFERPKDGESVTAPTRPAGSGSGGGEGGTTAGGAANAAGTGTGGGTAGEATAGGASAGGASAGEAKGQPKSGQEVGSQGSSGSGRLHHIPQAVEDGSDDGGGGGYGWGFWIALLFCGGLIVFAVVSTSSRLTAG